MRKQTIYTHGWDLALNHAGFVELKDGKFNQATYVTTVRGAYKNGLHVDNIKPILLTKDIVRCDDIDFADQARSYKWYMIFQHVLENFSSSSIDENFVGIEGFAFGKFNQGKTRSLTQIAEVAGYAKNMLHSKNIPFRLHDPATVKMFATFHSVKESDKAEIIRAVRKEWNVDFRPFIAGKNIDSAGDLADAFVIAKMVWYEYQLRKGLIELGSMHEKRIRVFNRVTKAYPCNIIGRDWIKRPRTGKRKNWL